MISFRFSSIVKAYPKMHPKALSNKKFNLEVGLRHGRPLRFLSPVNGVPDEMTDCPNKNTLISLQKNQLHIPQKNQHFMHSIIVGTPNSGKSTLINKLCGEISATSRKTRTTVQNKQGIFNYQLNQDGIIKNVQVLLTDSPGAYPRNKTLSMKGWDQISECDCSIFMVDCVRKVDYHTGLSLRIYGQKIRNLPGHTSLLVLNKIDKQVNSYKLRETVSQLQSFCKFHSTHLISLQYQYGVQELKKQIASKAKRGKWSYPKSLNSTDPQSDKYVQLMEQALMVRLHEEVPYKVAVRLAGYAKRSDGVLALTFQILVSNEPIKGMVIGSRAKNLQFFGDFVKVRLAQKGIVSIVKIRVINEKKKWRGKQSVRHEFSPDYELTKEKKLQEDLQEFLKDKMDHL